MENIDIYQLIVAAGAFIGTITGVWSLVQQKRKTEAEALDKEASAADTIQSASKELIDQYKIRINELIEENKNLKEQVIETKALKEQIVELNTEICSLKAEIEFLKSEIEKLSNKRRL